ncbi:Ig-like domain-containing protein [Sulfitobacter sp. HNIBRBA2951]|uniref:beta strand repeat-containing protein n=1 Tax=Sulfitobacter aquimarinus TaxID=3158557 RepID=UPI0032DEDAA3
MPATAFFDLLSTDEDTPISGSVFADNGNGADVGTNLQVGSVNGIAASVGQQITLASGALLTVNADGSFDYDPNGAFEALGAGDSQPDSFFYEVASPNTDAFGNGIDLADLDGSNGFRINGIAGSDVSGQHVSNAGDVNGDGFDDIIIGARLADPGGEDASGQSYVVFGSAAGFAADLDLASLDGTNGFRLNGALQGNVSGQDVSAAGDINGDGIDDIVIGAPGLGFGAPNAGGAHVVLGTTAGFAADFDLVTLDGSNGFSVFGTTLNDLAGTAVSNAGDINGDGIDDLIIGAELADPGGVDAAGQAYVLFGASGGFAATQNVSALDGTNGFAIDGIAAGDNVGSSVASAGDVNGDGIDDLVIGARGVNANGTNSAGAAYVVFGDTGGFSANLDLATLDGSNGFVVNGITDFDSTGTSVSSAGDINGDGIDDLAIGAPAADPFGNPSAGEVYIVYGSTAGYAANLNLFALDANDGFVINGVTGNTGASVSGAGDVNGDGVDDVIVGAPFSSVVGSINFGQSYVVFGNNAGFGTNLNLADIDGTNGFVINGINEQDLSGSSVSAAGDINGDGLDDLLIGAHYADPNGTANAGQSYVVFGSASFDTSVSAVFVDVAGANDAAVANDDTVAVAEDGITSGQVLADNGAGADSDVDAGDTLNVHAVNGDAANVGSQITLASGALVTVGADGTFVYDTNGVFDALATGESASDSFTYAVTDGSFTQSAGVFAASLALGTLDGTTGFVINGVALGDRAGQAVSSAGDVNADGIDDLIISAPLADPNGNTNAGTQYVVFGAASGFGSSFELSTLDGTNGFVLNGSANDEGSGNSVSAAGDVNGDGIDDIVIGASQADIGGLNATGQAHVVFGSDTGFAASTDLDTLNGTNGFTVVGISAGDFLGNGVSAAGDFNGDGFDDIILGASGVDSGNVNSGTSYLVFGSDAGFGSSFDLATLDGTNGIALNGAINGDQSGYAVGAAGDVNGDGFDDVIIGARTGYDYSGGSFGYAGRSFVVFGTDTGLSGDLDLSTLDGTNGFVMDGLNAYDYAGRVVSSAGDINGDGFDDIMIGAPSAGTGGEVYVVFGTNTGFTPSVDLAALNGTNGFTINRAGGAGYAGGSIDLAGDINGDGLDDIILSDLIATSDGVVQAGASYVVFGNTAGFGATLDLGTLDGTNGFALGGIDQTDLSGRSVSAAGDVNGDGIDDLMVGAFFGDPNGADSGEAYVVYGRATFTPVVDTATVTLTVEGANDAPVLGAIAQADVTDTQDIQDVTTTLFASFNDLDLTDTDHTLAVTSTGTSGVTNGLALDAADLAGLISTDSLFVDGGAGLASLAFTASSGAFDYLAAGETVTLGYQVAINDGNGGIGTQTFDVVVTGVSELTQARADVLLASETMVLSGSVLADNGGGADLGDNLEILAVNGLEAGVSTQFALPSGALLLLRADGTFDYDPNGMFEHLASGTIGYDTFTYELGGDAGGISGALAIIGILGADNRDLLVGTSLGDTLSGGNFADTLEGGVGADVLNGNNGNDLLDGGNGADLLDGGANDDMLIGFFGNDTLLGGTGDDTLQGQSGVDSLEGGEGADSLSAGGGSDVLRGDAGNDHLNGGSGNDLIYGGDENDTIEGQVGSDTIFGDGGDDVLNGGAGLDHIYGNAGNDTIDGGLTNDLLYGGDGADDIHGNSGSDFINGDDGDDQLFGEGGNDNMDGGAGDDTLMGGVGNDTLTGGAGADTLTGGTGADDFAFTDGFGADVVTDWLNNIDDFDLSGFAGASSFADVTAAATQSAADVLLSFAGGDTVLIQNATLAQLDAGDFVF